MGSVLAFPIAPDLMGCTGSSWSSGAASTHIQCTLLRLWLHPRGPVDNVLQQGSFCGWAGVAEGQLRVWLLSEARLPGPEKPKPLLQSGP